MMDAEKYMENKISEYWKTFIGEQTGTTSLDFQNEESKYQQSLFVLVALLSEEESLLNEPILEKAIRIIREYQKTIQKQREIITSLMPGDAGKAEVKYQTGLDICKWCGQHHS